MGQGTLVEMQIDGGKVLVESLRNMGFDVTVSGWTKASEEGGWYLYIASKDVEDPGLADAYRTVYTTIQANPAFGIDPFEVKLIGRENLIAKDLLAIRGTGGGRIATRSRRPKLGRMSVEETYVYAPRSSRARQRASEKEAAKKRAKKRWAKKRHQEPFKIAKGHWSLFGPIGTAAS